MRTELQAFKGAGWLAGFKLISQIFSWVSTIFVARMLSPEDYGLMAMATVITGYAMLFSRLGLGAAVIQRTDNTQRELSSVFWFTLTTGILFGLSCLILAYPTAWLFNAQRVIPITQAVSLIFIFSGLQIVPLNLLKKELRFKEIGVIEATSILSSCLFMLLIAYMGGGVWTLVCGNIIKNLSALSLIFCVQAWRPSKRFSFSDAISYLKFGFPIAIGDSLRYVNNKSDDFFAGRVWESGLLGFYSFAKQLSRIPNDKIVGLITQVSFPAFVQLKHDNERFKRFYLNVVKVIAAIILPLYVGGFLVGDELIHLLFNEKWYPMIFVFKYICLSEIITPLTSLSLQVHGALGRPKRILAFQVVMICFLPLSFFIVAPLGLQAIIIPWFTTYLFISLAWNYFTLKTIGVNSFVYLNNLASPIGGTIVMILAVVGYSNLDIFFGKALSQTEIIDLLAKILIGGASYFSYFYFFFFFTLSKIKYLRSNKE